MLQTESAPQDVFTQDEIRVSGSTNAPLGFVHFLPNQEYHRGVGLSNSGLKALRKSPWHYHAMHHLALPDWMGEETDAEASAALFAGTLCHCATLEPEAFSERYVIGPAINKNTKEWKAFVETSKPMQVITRKQREVAHAQAASLRNLADVAEILDGGEFEVSGYWIDRATGVLCRCRPDCMNRHFGSPDLPASMLLDVKTTQDASSTSALRNTVARFGYHHQADWYSRGVEAITGAPVSGFVFAFVESSYPFAARVVELDPEALQVARSDNDEALRLFAYCSRMNTWPSYPEGLCTVSLPRWAGGEA